MGAQPRSSRVEIRGRKDATGTSVAAPLVVRTVGMVTLLVLAITGCTSITPRVTMPWQGIADVAPYEPMGSLAPPTTVVHGERGPAPLEYPSAFSVVVDPDGGIAFPKDTKGHVSGASIVVGSTVLATLDDAGHVSGQGLKRKYTFDERGALVDELGRGVRISAEGRVRALGGPVRYSDVIVWKPETGMRGERWDMCGWRTLSIISLLVIENLLPDAVGLAQTSAAEVPTKKHGHREARP